MKVDDVRLIAGDRGDVAPPTLVKEFMDVLLCRVGVMDLSFTFTELKDGVLCSRGWGEGSVSNGAASCSTSVAI